MLPKESIPAIISLMQTVDFMKRNEKLWKGDKQIAANAAHYNHLVEDIFSQMTEWEKNQVLDLYRQQLATQSPISE